MSETQIRVRFAPSPTGYLHIGGARTALFAYLFARKHKGVFILRIEDTDRKRSTPEAVQAILNGLRYLGLDWDEGPEVGGEYGPYFQSERVSSYNQFVHRLLDGGKAYRCFCTKERLEALREKQKAAKERFHYDRLCLAIPPDEAARRVASGEPSVVRLAIPPGRTVVRDLIRGEVSFDHDEIEDFIIQRANGTCVYNLAVVGDDSGMRVTHVIRGEDHLTNTPKQILIFQALDLPIPRYAHIPLILGPGREKLSKRHGAVSVTEYQKNGYLPEAMINFLARLGWSYDDRQEIFSRAELIEKFSLEGISKSGAVYDLKKLSHLNGHYIRQRPLEDLVELCIPYLVEAGWVKEHEIPARRAEIQKMVELEKERLERLSQIIEKLAYYFEEPEGLEAGAVKVLRKSKDCEALLSKYIPYLEKEFSGDPQDLEAASRRFAESEGIALKDLAQPLRAVLTGRSATPPLFAVMAILGKETCLRRLVRAPVQISQAMKAAGSA